MVGGKLIQVGTFTLSMGTVPWPVVFLTTDLINEYFGIKGVQRLTFITIGLIIYTFLILFAAMQIPAAGFSPVQDAAFTEVFGQSLLIIVGSIVAFAAAQFIDVVVFWYFRARTQRRLLWLRATGSTLVSQFVDTFVVAGIAFWIPGKITTGEYLSLSSTNYVFKMGIAIAITPLIYLGHALVSRFLGAEANQLIESAAKESKRNLKEGLTT